MDPAGRAEGGRHKSCLPVLTSWYISSIKTPAQTSCIAVPTETLGGSRPRGIAGRAVEGLLNALDCGWAAHVAAVTRGLSALRVRAGIGLLARCSRQSSRRHVEHRSFLCTALQPGRETSACRWSGLCPQPMCMGSKSWPSCSVQATRHCAGSVGCMHTCANGARQPQVHASYDIAWHVWVRQ